MYAGNTAGLKPRNAHTLVVGIVARISGCANQKELSLDDQVDHAKALVVELYDGRVEYRIIRTTGKGERLDRPELDDIRRELRSGELDLLVMEDLGRLVRGGEAVRLFGMAVDNDTRAISPNDRVDTDNPTWEEDAFAACRDHVAHNAHTSRRLKHKLMNRFVKFGGAPARPVAGYLVPPGAKTYDLWTLDAEATSVIGEGLRLLKHTQNGETVAEYFNGVAFKGGTGFPPGPYCRRRRWNGRMALRYYRNLVLSGRPGRGFRHTVKVHETGRRVSVPSPDGPVFRDQPNLAHLDPDEQDEVIALVSEKNSACKRKGSRQTDPRWRTPKKRTRWPGQAGGTCWYCGGHFVWGGNGMTKNLMCAASREWRCWNSIGFEGALAARHVTDAIMAELGKLRGIDVQFRQLVRDADQNGDGDLAQRRLRVEQDERKLLAERERVKRALRELGNDPIVAEAMAEVADAEKKVAAERRALEQLRGRKLDLPGSAIELGALFQAAFATLAADSPTFGDLLRQVVPSFEVYLVRLCDGGHPLPRARVTLALDGLTPDAAHAQGLPQLLRRELTLDLFKPPQRERIRAEAVRLAAEGLGPTAIAERLCEVGVERPTSTAVQNALRLEERMRRVGLCSPYVLLTSPPADYAKLRRHLNAKYRFDPAEGYSSRPLSP